MGKSTRAFESSSPDETAALGRRLARILSPGSVVALVGPLGAGKSVFVSGLADGLGLPAGVTSSPTFTLINEYGGEPPLCHVDLYRIENRDELNDLGLEEYFDGSGIVAVEWSERAAHLMPPSTITVCFEFLGGRKRKITLSGCPEL